MPLRIITRAEWKARPPRDIKSLKTPVENVLFIQCRCKNNMSEAEICEWLPTIQTYHMDDEVLDDIPYHWLVDFRGTIYEGRGWKTIVHKKDLIYKQFNNQTLDVGFIGNFKKGQLPPRVMEKGATKLLEWGMKYNLVRNDNKLKIFNWNNFDYSF